MKVILSHTTALGYWHRQLQRGDTPLHANSRSLFAIHESELDLEQLRRIAQCADGNGPVHLLVASKTQRRILPEVKFHCTDFSTLPPDSFVRITQDIGVVCPELCLLQVAAVTDRIDLIVLMMEFCGLYRRNEDIEYFCSPLTNTAEIKRYANRCPSMRGRAAALSAVRYAMDNSASPMETALALMLSLPCSMGGCGFPKPLLNAEACLTHGSKLLGGRQRCYTDLLWPKQKLVAEYDSKQFHSQASRLESDAQRRSALMNEGYTVISVTPNQISNASIYNSLIALIAKGLQVRFMPRCKNYPARVYNLRKKLLNQ